MAGPGLPPYPVIISGVVGAANPAGAGVPKLWATGAATGAPKLLGCCPAGAGGVYVVPALDGNCMPPLLAPPSFSCVRP